MHALKCHVLTSSDHREINEISASIAALKSTQTDQSSDWKERMASFDEVVAKLSSLQSVVNDEKEIGRRAALLNNEGHNGAEEGEEGEMEPSDDVEMDGSLLDSDGQNTTAAHDKIPINLSKIPDIPKEDGEADASDADMRSDV